MGLFLIGEIQEYILEPLSHNLTEEHISEGEEAQEDLRLSRVCRRP